LTTQPGDTAATIPAKLHDKSGNQEHATLDGVGVADLDRATRREAGIPAEVKGALVTDVDQDSASWEAGLRPGDVIEEINRQAVAGAADAVRLTTTQPQRETLLRIWSHGSNRFLAVDESRDPS
jgi:serine protease Do